MERGTHAASWIGTSSAGRCMRPDAPCLAVSSARPSAALREFGNADQRGSVVLCRRDLRGCARRGGHESADAPDHIPVERARLNIASAYKELIRFR